MPTLGIIDDRQDIRETLKRDIDLELSGEWQSVDSVPLPALDDYVGWLTEHEVCVLLLDERLQEQCAIGYDGHDVVSYIRGKLPTFPIFIITAYPDDSEIVKKFSDVEEIISRIACSEKIVEYVPRFQRAAQRYVEGFQLELSELSEKSRKLAEGTASENDVSKIKALQSKLGLAFNYQFIQDRSKWLEEIE